MNIEIDYNGTHYHIVVESNCFIPVKHGVIKKSKNEENIGTAKENSLGYFSKLSNAVNAIIREEIANDDSSITLKEYVERWEKAINEMKEKIDYENL